MKERRKSLEAAKASLKKKFVGLDRVIDKIIDNISAWYLMPELLLKPVIINLWGLTGVGKTDLVRTLVRELELSDKFLEIQLKTSSNGHLSLEGMIEDSSIETSTQSIILLDEIQRFRTKDEMGIQQNNPGYEDIWTLLSDGKFTAKPNLYERLLSIMYYVENDEAPVLADNEAPAEEWSFGYYSARELKQLLHLEIPVMTLATKKRSAIIKLIKNNMKKLSTKELKCYSKMLIFVSGNLDEAFYMADAVAQTTIDADTFHEHSKKITIIDIKDALTARFNPEQISRLGNIHVIYPSLSKASYETIIDKTVDAVVDIVKKKTDVDISIDQSVKTAIYNNGVFPTQGVRPVFSTVKGLIEAPIPNFLLKAAEKGIKAFSIKIEDSELISPELDFKQTVELVLDDILATTDNKYRYLSAVHEAGHALAYCLEFGVAPIQITIKSVNNSEGGFVHTYDWIPSVVMTRKTLMVGLGGLAAERIVFGRDNTSSGAASDISKATAEISKAVRNYGFFDKLSITANAQTAQRGDPHNNYDDKGSDEVVEIEMQNALAACTSLIQNNESLYKKLVKELLTENIILPTTCVELCASEGITIIVAERNALLSVNYVEQTEHFLAK